MTKSNQSHQLGSKVSFIVLICMCVAHCIIRVVEELFYDIFPVFFQPYLERMWDLAEYFVAQLISVTSLVSLAQYPTHRVLHKSTHYVHNSLHVRMHL